MAPRAARQPKVRPPAPDALEARWRLFLAVQLSTEVKALVAEQIAALAAEGWPVRCVQPEGAHLTIHFLGDTEQEQAALLRLVRTFRVRTFADALALTQRVGELAESEGHHPAILTEWGKVTVSWWTHKIRGLHRNDFIMAAKTDALASESGLLRVE